MADVKGECCPPGSLKGYLNVDYKPIGVKKTFPKISDAEATRLGVEQHDVEAYCVGKSHDPTEAIIIVPDIWGWDSGKTRAIADNLSTCPYQVVVPKLLEPCVEGGIDGDGLPVDFDMSSRRPVFLEWIVQFKSKIVVGKVMSVINALKAEGVERFCLMGVCFGAWVTAHVSKIEKSVVGMVCPHPSIGLEQMIESGDPVALCKSIQCKTFFMPAGNDSEDYDEGGAMFTAIPPGSKTLRFPDMVHGWVPRGDRNDPKCVRDAEKAVALATEYINSCFAAKTNLMF
eukprot:m.110123 g.110123  ORF g.110123 m.110123 type:complete len:286 (+) comp28014_c1_seq1:377-1234(+)